MTTEVERLLPLVDQFLKAKPEGVSDQDWNNAAIVASIASLIHPDVNPLFLEKSWKDQVDYLWDSTVWHVLTVHRGKLNG